jgi:hypothetical protein
VVWGFPSVPLPCWRRPWCKLGTHPHDNPLTPNDLWATVYKHLGIEPDHNLHDQQNRPVPILPFGRPIRELL